MGLQGMGPVNKNSFPIYLGRFIDPRTKRVKLIGNPSKSVININDVK